MVNQQDIIVLSPYNVQVNVLRDRLPTQAQVGTVDQFQGQEAAIVLISMVTSSFEELSRNIEFLYSPNRLNVALSRAQCFVRIVMNPQLLSVPCKTTTQIKLLNNFCSLVEYVQNHKKDESKIFL